MGKFTQAERMIGIETSLGEDVLLLESFRGQEAISRPFRFQLELLSENADLKLDELIGQSVTIRISLLGGKKRYINGYVNRFGQSGKGAEFTRYQMEVVPWLWFLTRIADCRIFQNKTIPDILEDVFKGRGYQNYKSSLTGTYEKRKYCVQYRETDFAFVSRLMEEYGIYYFFEHQQGEHTLVLADSPSAHTTCPEQETARYNLTRGDLNTEDVITGWQMEQELRSGKFSLTDYNFKTPSTNLFTSEQSVVKGSQAKFELYDYPGDYLSSSQGRTVAKTRMEEKETGHVQGRGESACRAFLTGYKFTLADHFSNSANGEYLLTEIAHSATVGDTYTTGGSGGEEYANQFVCLPAASQFRPAQVTPRPFISGPQTAVVVGSQGEEIWVDKYGRVKVQFFWDRQGKKDENSSCWVRVSQAWAGKSWGAIWIPRVGQEVIVDFLEGDPDRPIVTGRVYNAEQTVPYALPDHNTRSTFLSRSSKGGGSSNFNEVRFEDKSGSEQIFINAEKDMDLRVEKESREYVGDNRHLIVQQNQKEKVGQSLHSEVGQNFNQKIGQNMSVKVQMDRQEKTGMKYAHEAGTEIHLKSGAMVTIEAGAELTLKVGGSFISMNAGEISIQAPMVLINSGGAAGSGSGSQPDDPEPPDKADDGSQGGKLS